jgi:alpha-glucosidase
MPWSSDAPNAGFSKAEPWLPIPDEHVRRAVSEQNGDAGSVLSVARALIELRRSSAALRIGAFRPMTLTPPLLGFDRIGGPNNIRCLFNLGKTESKTPIAGRVLFSCGDVDQSKGSLGPLAACILEI